LIFNLKLKAMIYLTEQQLVAIRNQAAGAVTLTWQAGGMEATLEENGAKYQFEKWDSPNGFVLTRIISGRLPITDEAYLAATVRSLATEYLVPNYSAMVYAPMRQEFEDTLEVLSDEHFSRGLALMQYMAGRVRTFEDDVEAYFTLHVEEHGRQDTYLCVSFVVGGRNVNYLNYIYQAADINPLLEGVGNTGRSRDFVYLNSREGGEKMEISVYLFT
jgi:hypothetical protein